MLDACRDGTRYGAMAADELARLTRSLSCTPCILHKANFRGLVLVGVEEFWNRKTRIDYPQAWWLRAPSVSGRQSTADEDDELDEIEYVLAVA